MHLKIQLRLFLIFILVQYSREDLNSKVYHGVLFFITGRTGSPQPPTGTKVNRRYDSLGVEWEEPEGDDVTGYRLEAGPPSNPRQFTRDFEPGTTSADIPGLTPDTDYQVNLYSTSRSGDSEPVRRKARTSESFPFTL